MTAVGRPFVYSIGCTSPVFWRTRRQSPLVTAAPTLNACEPVTYEADPENVRSSEKWSAGLFQAPAILPVPAEQTPVELSQMV